MKHLRKVMTLVLAMLLSLVAMTPAFADETPTEPATPTGKTITLTGGKAGHTYTLYQVFTGTVETVEGEEQLTNIQWGSGVTEAYKSTFTTAAAAAKDVADDDDARAYAKTLVDGGYLTGGTDQELAADGTVTFSNLAEGYYVIVDNITGDVAEEGDYSSAYIVQVVKDVTGAIKGSGTTSEKKVKTEDGTSQDAAVYNIGDDVPFELKATTADNAAAYRKYHITFQDKQSAGLDAPTSFTVTVLGKTFTLNSTTTSATQTTDNGTKITVAKVDAKTGNTFAIKVSFEPTGDDEFLNAECNSKDIVVSYTSKLNSNAKIGVEGNPNESYINYSNNPEDEDDEDEGKTPEDKVKVFTFKTVVDKVDADGNELKNAGFTIYQEVSGTTAEVDDGEGGTTTQTTYPDGARTGADIKAALADGVEASKLADDKYYITKAMTLVSGKEAEFEFKGLGNGKYVLVETTIPEGFNAFNSVEFTISSTVTGTELTTLTGGDPFTAYKDAAEVETGKGNTHNADSGELFAEIENNSGQTLPSTGGMGTTILYTVGGILIAAGGIWLVTKKRLSAME